MTTDDLQLPHSSGGTRCYRRRQSASASASVARIVVSRSPSPAPTRAMQRSAPRPAPSRAPRRPSRHPKMQAASRRRRPLSVATGSPAASLSCSIPARAPAVICSTCGSATLPGRCARGPPSRPDPPLACKRSPRRQFCSSHASAHHGARSRPSHASAHHGAPLWPPSPPQVHELPGSPHALTVSSTAADARGCTLFDAGARMHKTTQVAGTKLHAFIQVADRFGNSCLPQPGQC